MTACIVGWAHSRFGKLEGETLESLIAKVTIEALEHAGIGPDDVDEILLGHFNGGFSAQDFTASLVLQADDRFRFKPATRVENACATGSAAVRQGIRSIDARQRPLRAGGRRRADDHDARPRDRQEPAQGLLPAGGRRHAGRLCRGFRQDRAGLFPAPWRPVRRAGDDRRQEPQERRRQSLCAAAQGFRLRVLPARERQEPVRGRPAEADRLLAGFRRGGRAGARRFRHRARACAAPLPSAPTSTCRISCRCRSATSCSSRAARKAGHAR